MKQLFYSFFVVVILSFIANAQTARVINVPTFAASGQYLNQFIAADSVGRGTADNTTYVLARDAAYYANSYINNVGWTLRMRSSYGKLSGSGASRSGYPAAIFLKLGSSGTQVSDLVQIAGNVWLSNLEISGYDETVGSTMLGTLFEEILLCTAPGFNITIDSCIITNCGQGILRLNSAPRVVKITNSIFANMGSRLYSDLGNGRAVDCRNGSVDSLILQNNTFINNQDRVVRHYSSTAPIRYLKFDHNTLINSASFHGLLSFGYTQGLFSITNNLFVNPWAYGDDTDAVRQAEMGDNGELNPLNGLARMTIINAKPDTVGQPIPTTWTFKNNYYRITTSEQNWWTNAGANPVLKLPSPLPWHISKKIGTDSLTAFQATTADVNNVPALMTGTMAYYRSPSGANKTKVNNTAAPDMDRRGYVYLTDTLDCKYPTSASIYSAATGGQPVGSLMWWGIAVGVEKSNNPVPTGYALTQNYPNPFNPTTNFTYEISKAGFVSIKIYDILGREVATLVNEVKQAGSFVATWNAINAGSGIYFCKMQSGSFTATKKMILMK
ncbi:MAG: T9SS type A sorting domain-containing protein [Bacteroidota bacterium]